MAPSVALQPDSKNAAELQTPLILHLEPETEWSPQMEGLLRLWADSTTLSSTSVQPCRILFMHLVRFWLHKSLAVQIWNHSVTIPPSREASGSKLSFEPWLTALSTQLHDPYYLILVNWLNWGLGYHAASAKQYQKYPSH